MPERASTMLNTVTGVIFSWKNSAMMTATMTG
jgi:hypothetical protein